MISAIDAAYQKAREERQKLTDKIRNAVRPVFEQMSCKRMSLAYWEHGISLIDASQWGLSIIYNINLGSPQNFFCILDQSMTMEDLTQRLRVHLQEQKEKHRGTV